MAAIDAEVAAAKGLEFYVMSQALQACCMRLTKQLKEGGNGDMARDVFARVQGWGGDG